MFLFYYFFAVVDVDGVVVHQAASFSSQRFGVDIICHKNGSRQHDWRFAISIYGGIVEIQVSKFPAICAVHNTDGWLNAFSHHTRGTHHQPQNQ